MNKHRMASIMSAALASMMIVTAAPSALAAEEPAAQEPAAAVSTIASCSKTFAAAAVMQLADQGLVDIDKPVTEYLPEFRMRDPRYKDITVRMLMDHTSGIMGTTAGDFILLNDRDISTHDTLLTELRTQRLKADPGDYGAYCNDGFTLLELIVEEVTGESFTDYVQKHISKPLGMKSTGSAWDLFRSERQVGTFMNGIRFQPDYCMAVGSGGIISSAQDLCTFGSAFFKGDTRMLSEKAKSEMFRTYVTDQYEQGFGLGFDTVDFDDYKAAGVKVVCKGGDVQEQHASLVIAPDEQISVAVLSSGGGSTTDMFMAAALLDIALEDKDIHVEHPDAVQKETLDLVPEKYLSNAGIYLSGTGVCRVTFPDQRYMEIEDISSTRRETTQYLYTTEDSFVKMDGQITGGRAVQAKEQSVLHFVKRGGKDYIVSDDFIEIGLKGKMNSRSYLMQRVQANPVSASAQAAWDARSGKKYYFYNGKYSNAYYAEMPAISSQSYPELPGFANQGRIIDETHTEAALVMPGGRDLRDIEIRQKNGAEFLVCTNEAVSYISEDAIPELKSDLTEVRLHTKQAAWYRIGKGGSRTLTIDIPENAAVYVYDAFDHMTYSSYMTGHGNSVPLPDGGMIVFLGEDGGSIKITQ